MTQIHNEVPVEALNEILTVTVLETATIFEGPDTVYRYDIMATGIKEGWAVPAVVDQVQQLSSVHWPDVEVVIDGDDQVTEMLTRTFIGKGVTSYPADTLREHPLPPEEPDPDPVVTRPTSGRTHRDFYGIRPLHILLTILFVGVVAGAWMLLGGGDTPVTVPPVTTQVAGAGTTKDTVAPTTVVPATTGNGVPGAEGSGEAEASTLPAILEGDGFLVAAPQGYRLDNDDGDTGVYVLTGRDPDLRIRIALDPLHGLNPQLVAEEMELVIAQDPTLERQPTVDGRIIYSEDPGDGSKVAWTTWFDADQQVSVGCHTRLSPTVVQQAACRTVLDSLRVG